MDSFAAVDGRDYVVTIAGITATGPMRSENQDAVVIDGKVCMKSGEVLSEQCDLSELCCVAVVDGMGGHLGGADAAALAASHIARMNLHDVEDLNRFANNMSLRISYAGGAWQMPDMGAAFALVAMQPESVIVANVGDCRVYRLCGERLGQWSKDDRTSQASSSLRQALGGGATHLDAHALKLEGTEARGRFLLCSDGVWETLGDRLDLICTRIEAPYQVVRQISSECYARNAADNYSAICLDIAYAPRLQGGLS